MKILIINYRFFVSGGPERYMFNLIELLQENSHIVIPFSINYNFNLVSEYSDFFTTPISNSDSIYYKDDKKSFLTIKKQFERTFWSKEVYTDLSRLINNVKPDFAIVLHFLRKLSPSVLSALNDYNIPYVVRLSDFALVCPNALLLNNGQYCDKCIENGIFESVKDKCIQNSYSASLVNFIATTYHNSIKIFEKVPLYICPSKYLLKKMLDKGFKQEKLMYLPTFTSNKTTKINLNRHAITYVGRLEYLKGVHVFIDALIKIKNELKNIQINIIGDGDESFIRMLKSKSEASSLNIIFHGFQDKNFILNRLSNSLLSVVPSIAVDNLPNTLIESMSVGTPVIAPDHGSFPDFIIEEYNGYLFKSGNSESLAYLINKFMLLNNNLKENMFSNCINYIKANHSKQLHYERLYSIIKEVRKEN